MVPLHRWLVISALLAAPATADTLAETQDELRDAFVKSYTAIAADPDSISEMMHETLGHYPLYPYLEYRLLNSQLEQQTQARIDDFLQRHEDTPLYGRLLFAWARHTGEQGHWQNFEQTWSRIQRPSTSLQCLNGRRLLDQGSQDAAWQTARMLWTVGHSQPDICDPLFEPWLKSDNFTSADALNRYVAALTKGRTGLATYITRFLTTAEDKLRAEQALKLYKTPRLLLDDPNQLSKDHPHRHALLEMNVRRLARSDLDAAIRLWVRDRDRLQVPEEAQQELTGYLGVWRSKRFPGSNGRQLLAKLDPHYTHAELTGWRIRLALTDRDWQQVNSLIGKLPESERLSDRWQYWDAIARQHLGKPVQDQLRTLAGERSFYGFMAAQLLGQDYALNDEPAQFSQEALDTLAATPSFERMRELLALERYTDARSEWNLAVADMTPEQIHLAAHLVKRFGWHHQGIRGAIKSGQWNDMQLRFPAPHTELYQRHAKARSIDPTWALAVTRQESAFWMGARSHVGARGLMQLMPATARATARRHGIPLAGLGALNEPDTNIQLGTAYLSEVAKRFDGNQAYASAAYNAGPHRVSRWLEARGKLPLDIWIETIPFDETRGYVQNVLSFRVIYERLANRPVALFSEQEFSMLALQQ
ncbi:transglycosylase SLT domain-containing protein [Marinobacterium weihaiense]|uniref:Transglycosylase SLT domain-containing protein n=1 Tax=Marinobacterium weihaiense TaxID=2851016 RepID=A0ABS6M6P7_9GAMM|nr:transglycosylase SLT domain-containing protein [Marinobacterium weihaiense]MBV0931953.1 transglycosylase SLT domain-containing protein [Marinobacterium weihaiense]